MRAAWLAAAALAAAVQVSAGTQAKGAQDKAAKGREAVAYWGKVAKKASGLVAGSHLSNLAADDAGVSRRAWTNAVERYDGEHMVLLAGDIENLAKAEGKVGKEIAEGKIRFPFLLRRIYGARLLERTQFATNHLAAPFKLTGAGKYGADRSGAAWLPAGEERDGLWRRRLESEVADLLLDEGAGVSPSQEKIDAAAAKVAKGWLEKFKKENAKSFSEVCTDFISDYASAWDAHTRYFSPEEYANLKKKMSPGKVSAAADSAGPAKAEKAFSRLVEMPPAGGGAARKLGYLRLSAFYTTSVEPDGAYSGRSSAEDLKAELEKLGKAGAEGVLFDLRGNAGGALDDAVKTIGCFVRSGPAVRMAGTGGDVSIPVPSDAAGCDTPVVVLIDRGSASAGELVPATLQDTGRAIVAGDVRTFGKGTAQAFQALDDGKEGALATTVSRFYRITGASTQFKGVEPDVEMRSLCGDYAYRGERGARWPLEWDRREPLKFGKSWDLDKFVPQLREASRKRLAKDAAWKKYRALVEESERQCFDKSAPLALAGRAAARKAAKSIEKELEKLAASRTRKARIRAESGEDPVRDEAFRILRDLVELNGGRRLPAAAAGAERQDGLLDSLEDD